MKNITDIPSLLTAAKAGASLKYLFFWGHRSRSDGQISKSCLSQWWPSSFTVNDVTYATAEHFMMAEKARLFEDQAILGQILTASHPSEAKKLGRQVRGFEGTVWQQHRFEIVFQGNLAKFAQNEVIKQFLLNTKERVLVEASPYDQIWGIGLAEDNPKAQDPEQWQGLNLLGFALMAVRRQLAEEKR